MDIINSYYNDGYIYCLKTPLYSSNENLVKIGKISMKKKETEQQIVDKLIRRYSTYYSDNFEIIYFKRVGNCHEAEKEIFNVLKNIHYKKEMYLYKQKQISSAFDTISAEYPCLQTLLNKVDVYTLSSINKTLRQLESNT